MTRLAELLDAAVPPREPSFDEHDVHRRARTRQRRRRGGAGLALVVLLAAVVAFAARATTEPVHPARRIETEPTTAPRPHGPGIFGVQTGVTLLFDAGRGRIAGVPLDGGETRDRAVYPADDVSTRLVPHPLFVTGGSLIITKHDVLAVRIHDALGRRVAENSYAVPATEPHLFWVVEDHGGIDLPYTVELVNSDNNAVLESGPALDPKLGTPQTGVAKQVALATNDGVQIYDPLRHRVTHTFGSTPVFVGDANASRVTWCEQTASIYLHVSDVDTGADRAYRLPNPMACRGLTGSRFSPDGRYFAMPVGGDGGVVVIDTARHTARTVLSDRRMHGDISIAWSPDGMQLFASGGGAVMARYEVTTGHAQIVGADGVLHGFVAVSNDDARAFFAASGPRG